MPARQPRSHKGCWTCKQRKKKCDEAKPKCLVCSSLNISCQGYGVRLTWGNGIATRGRFAGASAPTEHTQQPVKGRVRDRLRRTSKGEDSTSATLESVSVMDDGIHESCEGILCEDSRRSPVSYSPIVSDVVPLYQSSSPTPQSDSWDDIDWSAFSVVNEAELDLLREFFTVGHLALYSTDCEESPIRQDLIPLCRISAALRKTCIAYQSMLKFGSIEVSLDLYGSALQMFRQDLANPRVRYVDSTLATGILLCSIGISQGFSWLFHLPAMEELVNLHVPSTTSTTFRRRTLDVLGYLDLPTLVINRQHKSLGLWKRYCSGIVNVDTDEIELCSGLPRSFLDIMSCIEEQDAEKRFWLWHGHVGNLLQSHLWAAYRYAGMLKCREIQRERWTAHHHNELRVEGLAFDPHLSRTEIVNGRPSDVILVNNIVGSLDAIQHTASQQTLVMNAIFWPLALAAMQVDILNAHPDWKQVVDSLLAKLYGFVSPQVACFQMVLDELRKSSGLTADAIAKQIEVEVSLI